MPCNPRDISKLRSLSHLCDDYAALDALVTELMDQEPSHLVPLVPPVLQASHSPHSPQAPVVVPVAANVEPHPSNTTVAFVERHGQIENRQQEDAQENVQEVEASPSAIASSSSSSSSSSAIVSPLLSAAEVDGHRSNNKKITPYSNTNSNNTNKSNKNNNNISITSNPIVAVANKRRKLLDNLLSTPVNDHQSISNHQVSATVPENVMSMGPPANIPPKKTSPSSSSSTSSSTSSMTTTNTTKPKTNTKTNINVNANVRVNANRGRKRKRTQRHGQPDGPILVGTMLNSELSLLLDATVKKINKKNQFKAIVRQNIDHNTTHIVAAARPENSRRCARSMKYFKGVALGLWIVTPAWIRACNEAGEWLPTDEYEVTGGEHDDYAANDNTGGGPHNSRIDHERANWDRPNGTLNLLQGITMCLHGNYNGVSLRTWDLKQLALMAGASVVATPKRRSAKSLKASNFTSSSSSSSSSFSTSNNNTNNNCDFVLCPKNTTSSEAKRISQQTGLPVVSHSWLLDSIGTWIKNDHLAKKWILSQWKPSSKSLSKQYSP